MKSAARPERVFPIFQIFFLALITWVISGCAGSAMSGTAGDTPSAVSASDDAQQAPAVSDTSSALRAEVIQPASQHSIGLDVAPGRNFDKVVIHPDVQGVDYKVSRLNNPERLVVDLVGSKSTLHRDFAISDSSFISKIRVGSHPDKTRVVFDLSDKEFFLHNVQKDAQGITVTLSREGFMDAALTTPVTASGEVLRANAPAPSMPSDSGDLLKVSSTDTEPTLVEAMDGDTGSRAKINSLNIQSIGEKGNALFVDTASAGAYTLNKTAPSEYVLTLENTGLDAATATTVLAPPQSGMIRSARPVKKGKDVLVRIFASPEANLVARARSGKIMVASQGDLDGTDMRAQFAPPAETKEADAKAPAAKDAKADDKAKKEVTVSDKKPDAAASAGGELDNEVSALLSESPKYSGRLISLDLQDTDIDNALRIIAEVSNLNIIASDKVSGKVTLRLIDVPWDQALDVILKTNGLDKVQEGNVIRIAPVEDLRQEREALKQAQSAEEELEPLTVKYIRVSYAKASDLKPLVETVLSERGNVSYDERSNQLIVKDIRKGIRNVAELVAKLDLRTPQVLLETQIVESRRNLLRDLGSELGFQFVQSPATGNATGYNFPNSVTVAGSAVPGSGITGSAFPAAISGTDGSAINVLLGSADGTATLNARLSALEEEGRIRIVSRPAVATTNNTKATIKSVEKIRVKTPSGGLSVATGQGASASGASGVATETIEIGITLNVTPQASPDYYVLLDVNAKSSTFGSRIVDGIPSEVERSANSTVLVSSGQTFAMGGIYKITDQDSVSGVPFLKDIPVLGTLFRRTKVDNSDEELVFFLTPRIIEGSFDDAAMKAAS